MACTVDTKMSDMLALMRVAIKNKAKGTNIHDGYASFSFGPDFKTKEKHQAVKAARNAQKRVEKLVAEKIHPKLTQGWTDVVENDNEVTLTYRFPKYVENILREQEKRDNAVVDRNRAEQKKRSYFRSEGNEFYYNGEMYPTREDMYAAMREDMSYDGLVSSKDLQTPYYGDYINMKKILRDRLDLRISKLFSKYKEEGLPRAEKRKVSEEINYVKEMKTDLDREIKELENSSDHFSKVMEMFDNDLALIDNIVNDESPSTEDLDMATYLVNYLGKVSAYELKNTDNIFLSNVEDDHKMPTRYPITQYSPELREALDKIESRLKDYRDAITMAERKAFSDMIEKYPKVHKLYPQQPGEEGNDYIDRVTKEILKDRPDLDVFSAMLLSIDKSMYVDDGIIAKLERARLQEEIAVNSSKVRRISEVIDKYAGPAARVLRAMGFTTDGMGNDTSYQIYRQKDEFGNDTGRMVSKFSHKWYTMRNTFMKSNSDAFHDALIDNDVAKMRKASIDRYNWVNANADFVDITMLPEIMDDPNLQMFEDFFTVSSAEAEQYKQELIDRIGQEEYDTMLNDQVDMLMDYAAALQSKVDALLASEGVNNVSQLTPDSQYKIDMMRTSNCPFLMLEAHKSGNKGAVTYDVGNNNSQMIQSTLKYNAYIPKKSVKEYDGHEIDPATGKRKIIDRETGFYDKDFETIENNDDLLGLWRAMDEALSYMNLSVADAFGMLTRGTLPSKRKAVTELGGARNVKGRMTHNFYSFMKNLFSSNEVYTDPGAQKRISTAGISMTSNKIAERVKMNTRKMSLMRGGKKVGKSEMIDIFTALPAEREFLLELTGYSTEKEFFTEVQKDGGSISLMKVIESFSGAQVMEEQTTDIPHAIKVQLELVANYKARKDAEHDLRTLSKIYNQIKAEPTWSSKLWSGAKELFNKTAQTNNNANDVTGINNVRSLAVRRENKWLEAKLYGNTGRNTSGALTKMLTPLSKRWPWINPKNYSEEELKLKAEAKEQIDMIDTLLKTANGEKRARLMVEKAELENFIDRMGKVYSLAAMWDKIAVQGTVYFNLALNPSANLNNRLQGLHQSMMNDTGLYWPEGSFDKANQFLMFRGVYGMSNFYNEEIKKGKMMIDLLNVITDGSNENDRAKRVSGYPGWKQAYQPMWGTQYVEWNNQAPTVLAVLSDYEIEDVNGKKVKVFDPDTKQFPAHRIENGKLVLKDEFRTDENIEDWEKMASQKYKDVHGRISGTINIMNGDYSELGTMMMKHSLLGRTFSIHKTWFPNMMWQRFAYKQQVLDLGIERFDGIYTGSFLSSKTGMGAAATMAVSGAAVGLITGGLALPIGIGIGALATAYHVKNAFTPDRPGWAEMKVGAQLAKTGIAIIKRMAAMPTKLLLGTAPKRLNNDFKNMELSDMERYNLKALVNETAAILWVALMKVGAQALLGDHEDDEPKYLTDEFGKEYPNPRWKRNRKTETEKTVYYFVENRLSRILSDITMYTNPTAIYDLATLNAVALVLKDIQDLNDAAWEMAKGTDEIMSGANQGDNKVVKAMQTMAPGLLRMERHMQRDFDASEPVDDFFDTDYKKDRKQAERMRKIYRNELREMLYPQYGITPELEELDPFEYEELKKEAEAEIREEIEFMYPMPVREDYSTTQDKY